MIVSEKILKWGMRFYPPLFFQRIWVKNIHQGFRGADVKINKSLFNKNYNGSIFGGTIYAATDPFYALLFDQLLRRKGFILKIWLKSASIQYIKPGHSSLFFTILITDDMLNEAIEALNTSGKFVKAYPMEILNKQGEVCARVLNEVYIRNVHHEDKKHEIHSVTSV